MMAPSKKKIIHDQELISLAVKEVESGSGKIREVARKYGIPKSTLHFKLKNPGHRASFGPPPVLTYKEEEVLEDWITMLGKKGFPLKKEDLQRSVQKFLQDNPRPNGFKDNYPGAGWVRGFLKRHPNIASRTSEGVTHSSACVSESDIRKWFSEINRYFEDNNLFEVLNDPSRVYNGDESGFQLCPKSGKVLAAKGSKNVYTVDSNNSKESITVMFTFSAHGDASPPMVVYNYQRIPQKIAEGVPEGWGVGRSESGWMTSELFFEYIANVFHPYLLKKGVTLPVIYFLDGHKTHLTYEVSKLCNALDIVLIALYPNATRILQPADVAVFRPVKAAWKEACRMWVMENPNEPVTKANFAKVLDVALKKAIKPETLINGFKVCGLFPFNPDAVDFTKCLGTNKQSEQDKGLVKENAADTITLPKFIDLIGATKIDELRTCSNVYERDENFQLLHKLYRTLDSGTFSGRPDQSLQDEQSLMSPEIVNYSQALFEDSTEVLTSFQEPTLFTDLETPAAGDSLVFRNITTAAEIHSVPSTVAGEMIVPSDTISESVVNHIESTPSKDPALQTNNERTITENSPAFKIISNSLIGTYLTVPKTPERKGKRTTLKMPFAVSSDSYRAMFKEQKAKKDTEIEKKEERKRIREETKEKKDKENKEKSGSGNKKKRQTKNIPAVTNTCTLCSKTTKTIDRVICDMCSSIFHVKCVPKKHKDHVPEDKAIDLFVCHKCYVEDDDDDETLDGILDNEIPEEDTEETDMIFELYKNNKNKY